MGLKLNDKDCEYMSVQERIERHEHDCINRPYLKTLPCEFECGARYIENQKLCKCDEFCYYYRKAHGLILDIDGIKKFDYKNVDEILIERDKTVSINDVAINEIVLLKISTLRNSNEYLCRVVKKNPKSITIIEYEGPTLSYQYFEKTIKRKDQMNKTHRIMMDSIRDVTTIKLIYKNHNKKV